VVVVVVIFVVAVVVTPKSPACAAFCRRPRARHRWERLADITKGGDFEM